LPARCGRNTDSEQALWSHLRRKQLLGIQFYRQKPIGNYVIGFYKSEAGGGSRGSQHLDADHAEKDMERDCYLTGQGLIVLRFNNLQVLQELDAVMEVIFQSVTERVGD
jgi:very-short-patch-repair endonuclease